MPVRQVAALEQDMVVGERLPVPDMRGDRAAADQHNIRNQFLKLGGGIKNAAHG